MIKSGGYAVLEDLHRRGEMTVRVAYNLFTQKKGEEVSDFTRWGKLVKPGTRDAGALLKDIAAFLPSRSGSADCFLSQSSHEE